MSKTVQLVKILAQASKDALPQHKLLHDVKTVKERVHDLDKNSLHGELAQLEQKMQKVLSIENLGNSEVAHLKQQVHDMRFKLSLADSKQLKKRLDRILFLLGEIAARADAQAQSKEQHEQRVVQIDKKINSFLSKKTKSKNWLASQLSILEKHYAQLKEHPEINPGRLAVIESRIQAIRQKLDEEAEIYTTKPIPSPRLFFPEEHGPIQKHKMILPSERPLSRPDLGSEVPPTSSPEITDFETPPIHGLGNQMNAQQAIGLPPIITIKRKVQEQTPRVEKTPRIIEKPQTPVQLITWKSAQSLPSVITVNEFISDSKIASSKAPFVDEEELEQEENLPKVITTEQSDKVSRTTVPALKENTIPENPLANMPSVITIKKGSYHTPLSQLLGKNTREFPSVITMKETLKEQVKIKAELVSLNVEKPIPRNTVNLQAPDWPTLTPEENILLQPKPTESEETAQLLKLKIPTAPKLAKYPETQSRKLKLEHKVPALPKLTRYVEKTSLKKLKLKIPPALKLPSKVKRGKGLSKLFESAIIPKDTVDFHSIPVSPEPRLSLAQELKKRLITLKRDAQQRKQPVKIQKSILIKPAAQKIELPLSVHVRKKNPTTVHVTLWPFVQKKQPESKKKRAKHHFHFFDHKKKSESPLKVTPVIEKIPELPHSDKLDIEAELAEMESEIEPGQQLKKKKGFFR